jgi:hypothetical protein
VHVESIGGPVTGSITTGAPAWDRDTGGEGRGGGGGLAEAAASASFSLCAVLW